MTYVINLYLLSPTVNINNGNLLASVIDLIFSILLALSTNNDYVDSFT